VGVAISNRIAAWGQDTEVFLTDDMVPTFWECAESFATV
jgi:hypothetical protein